jgi:hypothetical protein
MAIELDIYRDNETNPDREQEVTNELECFLWDLDVFQNGLTATDIAYMGMLRDQERYNRWMNTTETPFIPDGIYEDGCRFSEDLARTYSDWYSDNVASTESEACNNWEKRPPFHCHYTQVKNPAHLLAQSGIWPGATQQELSAVTCGRGGDHLRRITEETGVTYIWCNRNKGCFEVWGPRDQIPYTKEALHLHMIHEIGNRFVAERYLDHEDLATAYAKAVLSCDNLSEWQDNNLANNLTCVPVSL